MFGTRSLVAFIIATSMVASSAYAAPIFYSDRPTFTAQLDNSITDDYSNPAYQFINTNAGMTSVLGETIYTSTQYSQLNYVIDQKYCSGCNGTFRLTFTDVSVGNSSGVFGVGFDNFAHVPYFAFITFGDGSLQDVQVSNNLGAFWGVTSTAFITSIHFGTSGGGATFDTYIQIDNLTIGDAASGSTAVPEPELLPLFGLGLLGLGLIRGKKRSS